jgi:tRNA A37 threonylcarbamoyladenosine modification protein TsaB
MLSIFVNGHKYFVATEKYEEGIWGAEKIIPVLEKTITKEEGKIVFSSGPDTFTSIRVIGSIVKGISLCAPQMTFLAVSNFLTLFSLVPKNINSGGISIDTMRGDFYGMDFTGVLLTNYRLLRKEEWRENDSYVLYNNEIDDRNLAVAQVKMLDSAKFKANQHLVSKSLKINYGTIPRYKY